MRALMPHVGAYRSEAAHLTAVIDGCEMDLLQSRYLDYPGLERYCHLVAGVVGEVASNIFGRTEARTLDYAHRLGMAMQLTNIIRDVGDDARRGRIYLPISELQCSTVKAQEILNRTLQRPLHGADEIPGGAAHRTYDEAFALLAEVDRRAQKPGLMMGNIYRTLLTEIEADGIPGACTSAFSLTPVRKLWIAMRTNWRGR
jgi:phytoene synthase